MATRTKHQRAADLELVNAWYLQGKSQQWIADELKQQPGRDCEVSQQTISNDLKAIRKLWRESRNAAIDDHCARELARIDLLEAEYWKQYEASMLEMVETTEQTSDKDGTSRSNWSVRKEKRTGNPAYMAGVERCIKLRMDILGLEAPKEMRFSGVKDAPPIVFAWTDMEDGDNSGHGDGG